MRVEFNTFGSDYDTTLSAYTGARGGLTQIACNDNADGLLPHSRVTFATDGESDYFIIAEGRNKSVGSLKLLVTSP